MKRDRAGSGWGSEPMAGGETVATHKLVLVGGHRSENCLRENEGAELLRLEVDQRSGVVFLPNDVNPRLVFVHGV